MDYFSNIEFLNSGTREGVTNSICRVFDYWGLQFVWKGESFIRIGEGETYTASAPCFFITFPGVKFSYGSPPGKMRSHSFCCFQGKRVEEYIRSGLLPIMEGYPYIHLHDHKFFLEKFRLLIRQLRLTDPFHHAKSVLLLEEVLLALQEEIASNSSRSKNHLFELRALQEEIACNPEKKWDFAQEARKLSLSYSQLRFLFRELTGSPPWHYLLECRLRKGEELLLYSHLRINEIAPLCGFEDEFHFSRSFRQNKGVPPSRFRESYSKGEG